MIKMSWFQERRDTVNLCILDERKSWWRQESVLIDEEHGSAELKRKAERATYLMKQIHNITQCSGGDSRDPGSSLITSSPTMERNRLTATGTVGNNVP